MEDLWKRRCYFQKSSIARRKLTHITDFSELVKGIKNKVPCQNIMISWLVVFYGISTLVGYLRPNQILIILEDVMVKALDSGIIVREFDFSRAITFTFKQIPSWKVWTPLSSH